MASPEGTSNGTWEGLPCSLCECLIYQQYRPMSTICDFRLRLFHNSCEECRQNIDSSDCCTFCQHLCIRHLLICSSKIFSSTEMYASQLHLQVELGTFPELQSRQHCPLCRFFCDLITNRYCFWQKPIPDEGNPIFLEIGRKGFALQRRHGEQKPIEFSVRDTGEHYRTPATLSSKVDWGALCEWRHIYWAEVPLEESEDLSSQYMSIIQRPQNFLMIDVDRGCIVSIPRSYTYAALSYVWGNPAQGDLQATQANIGDLRKPGALKQAGIPLTIRDAMTAASELEISYLWVDRLCIVQDDPQTKHDLINQMDSIYASALLTFVAGGGNDASYGLPGVSTERSPGQAHISIQGVELTEKLPAFVNDIVSRMAWNQRGWTYQEAMFSANLIFFTDYGVFYERKKSYRSILAEPPNPPTTTTSVFSSIKGFFKSVEAYSGRTLSYETDIERAFSGVLQRSYGKEHAYGSPLRSFDAALCWNTKDRRRGTRQSTENDIFPSWSWLSVLGGVDFSGARSARDSLPVTTWAINLRTVRGNSELRFIGHESDEKFKYNSSLLGRAWKAGFFEGKHPSHSEKATTPGFKFSTQWSQSIWKSYQSFWFQSRGLQSSSTPSQLGLAEKYPLCLRPGHILVRTQSARFPKDLIFDYEKKGPTRDGECVEGMQQSCECSVQPGRVGMIALSFTESDDLSNKDHDYDDPKLDRRHRPRSHKRIWRVNVMQIRHVDGVAYRMGLGSVTLEEWKAAKPVFETIVLG